MQADVILKEPPPLVRPWLFNNFQKIDSQNVTTQMDDLESRLCAQTR